MLKADAYHPSTTVLGARSARYTDKPGPQRLFQRDVDDAHAHGVRVNVWTINAFGADTLARHLLAIGVDGIITDYPQALEALLDEKHGKDTEGNGVGRRAPFASLPEFAGR